MKKGLLLSIAATAVIFAGGDIVPVEPEVAPAPSDFWGQIGFRYEANDLDFGVLTPANRDLGDEENNKFSAAIVLGVEKQLGAGFGFGAELAGWSDFGFDIADLPAVDGVDQTGAEVSQAYLTYSIGNTAFKMGRQALPKAVSPWAWSDRDVGVIDISYDAVVAVNTSFEDTTIVGAWVANAADAGLTIKLGDDHSGIFMLGLINTSLPNTKTTLVSYYYPKANLISVAGSNPVVPTVAQDIWSVWASTETKYDTFNFGLQAAYVDGDFTGLDATYGIAAKIGSTWGNVSAETIVSYINDGDYSLMTAGTGLGTSAFWGRSIGGFLTPGDTVGDDQTTVEAKVSYKGVLSPDDKLYSSVAYVDYGDAYAFDNGFGARIGYKFTVAGVNANVEYRYADFTGQNGTPDLTKQRVRVEAYYKF